MNDFNTFDRENPLDEDSENEWGMFGDRLDSYDLKVQSKEHMTAAPQFC
jgi:hypothetical protein